MRVIIKIVPLVPFDERHREDQDEDPTGEYTFVTPSVEKALNMLHATVPIANLDHWHIEARQL